MFLEINTFSPSKNEFNGNCLIYRHQLQLHHKEATTFVRNTFDKDYWNGPVISLETQPSKTHSTPSHPSSNPKNLTSRGRMRNLYEQYIFEHSLHDNDSTGVHLL